MKRDTPVDDLLDLAIRESLGGRMVSALASAAARAWAWSSSRRVVGVAATKWQALQPPQKVRAGASAAIIAVVVHRMMALLGPAEPLGAVVPLLALIAGIVIWALAAPIAREWERLRR
jgi:hypothetical protein